MDRMDNSLAAIFHPRQIQVLNKSSSKQKMDSFREFFIHYKKIFESLIESEINWRNNIHDIYLFMPNGICIYNRSFKSQSDVEPQLVAGGLTGIFSLIQSFTQNQSRIKIVEQEEMAMIFEHGEFLSAALITEKNSTILRNKLKKLIEIVEKCYQEMLEKFSGKLGNFQEIEKFVQKIFKQ